MTVPTVSHPTGRLNYCEVTVNGTTYYFSYRTCIAFNRWDGRGPVVRENVWSTTTGKHLNYIDPDKTTRVNLEVFNAALLGSETPTRNLNRYLETGETRL